MYYLGNGGDMPVKPVTRRTTLARGQRQAVGPRYLQRRGRKPLNRIGYPTMGTPISADMALSPGSFGDPEDVFSMKGLNPIGKASRGSMTIAAYTSSGRRILTKPYDPYSRVALGDSILDPLAPFVTTFTPSLTTAPAVAPASTTPSGGGFLDTLISGVGNLFSQVPAVIKNIGFKIDPNMAIAAAQKLVSAGQVKQAVDYLNSVGVSPTYLNIPISGNVAAAGYQAAGFNMNSLTQYLPWILGGVGLLVALPLLTGRK